MADIDLGIPGLTDYEEIGAGGFATVYSAWEPDAQRRVAVKLLAAMTEQGRRRFDRERRTMGQTSAHDNIVTMFRSGYTEPDQRPYMVMEHMTGGSLQDRLDLGYRYAPDEAIELLLPIVGALDYTHTAGIVHKDVKPANILISETGTPKLTDFGIAAIKDATGTSELLLSLSYAPPETFDAAVGVESEAGSDVGDPRDERSDLYSLAATLYALVNGTPPFRGRTREGLLRQILMQAPPTIGDPRFDEFLATALAKKPDDRFPVATEYAAALRTITEPGYVVAMSESPSSAAANPEPATEILTDFPHDGPQGPPPDLVAPAQLSDTGRARRATLVGGLALVAVVLAALIAWSLWPQPDNPTVVASAQATPTIEAEAITAEPVATSPPVASEPAAAPTSPPAETAAPTSTTAPASTAAPNSAAPSGEIISCEVTPAQIADVGVRSGVDCGWAIWVHQGEDSEPAPVTEVELAASFEWCAGSHKGLDLTVEFTDGDPAVNKSFVDQYERVTLDGTVKRISYSFPDGLEVSAKNQVFACEGHLSGNRFVLSGSSEALIERP